VRARGLAIFVTEMFGSLTAARSGDKLLQCWGCPPAHFLAAVGVMIALTLTWRWKLQTGAAVDQTPSMHWPTPVLTHDVESDQGLVLVTVEYRIDPRDREPFLAAIEKLGQERRGDGAYAWSFEVLRTKDACWNVRTGQLAIEEAGKQWLSFNVREDWARLHLAAPMNAERSHRGSR
jgi:hypothetical protein